jgi:hypothetical protein
MQSCSHVDQATKDLLTGKTTDYRYQGMPSLQEFVYNYCAANHIFFPLPGQLPAVVSLQTIHRVASQLVARHASEAEQESRLRPEREEDDEKEEKEEENDGDLLDDDLLDAVREAMSQHGHAMLLETMAYNLEELPYDDKVADTPFGLFLADIFEPVLLRRGRCISRYKPLFDSRDSDSLVIIQCRFCHAECGGGTLNEDALVIVDDAKSDTASFSGQIIELLYKHAPVCMSLPADVRRRLLVLRFLPRSPQFNRFAKSIHQRCLVWLPWLEEQQKKSSSNQYQEATRQAPEMWASLTSEQVRQVAEKRGGVVPYVDIMDPDQKTKGPGSAIIEYTAPLRYGLLRGGIEVPSYKNPMMPRLKSVKTKKQKEEDERPGCKVVEVEEIKPLKCSEKKFLKK